MAKSKRVVPRARRTRWDDGKPRTQPKLNRTAERGLGKAPPITHDQVPMFATSATEGRVAPAVTHCCSHCGAYDPELGGYFPLDTGGWWCRNHLADAIDGKI